jgi:ABC-type glycerol-3-phosphate transport system substrate-binding protein
MNDAKDKDACWEFIKWLLSAEVQATYGRDLESVVGTAARYNTANIEAMNTVKWDSDIKVQLEKQRQQLRAYPQIAGGYMTDREFNFAFRKIVYENESVRIAMSDAAENISLEILRKREEYGLDN